MNTLTTASSLRSFWTAPALWPFSPAHMMHFTQLAQVTILLLAVPLALSAATITNSPSTNINYIVTDRGLHHRQWARVDTMRDPRTGQLVARTNIAYIEMATGMHYADPQTGKMIESRELIEA